MGALVMSKISQSVLALVVLLAAHGAKADGEEVDTGKRQNDLRVSAQIDPQIHTVITAGCWKVPGTREGRYRLVVVEEGFERLNHRMFLQDIEVDPDRGGTKIVKTVEVEIPESRRFWIVVRLLAVAREDREKCGEMVFTGIVSRYRAEGLGRDQRFWLKVLPEGSYQWSEWGKGEVAANERTESREKRRESASNSSVRKARTAVPQRIIKGQMSRAPLAREHTLGAPPR